jgi:hypothetical protein
MSKLEKIEVSMKEIYDAMKPNVYRNKKKYNRKKQKRDDNSKWMRTGRHDDLPERG